MLSSIAGFVIAITGVIAGILALLSDELKENKRLKYVLVAVLLAFSVYAILGSLMGISKTDTSASKLNIPIAIDATKDWQSTGFLVEKGDKITIRVVGGKWTNWRELLADDIRVGIPADVNMPKEVWLHYANENDGRGNFQTCAEVARESSLCPIKDFKEGALVSRIGEEKYGIGNGCSFISVSSGQLSLRINDIALSDNSGVLAVEILHYQSIENINSDPLCGKPMP